MTSPRPRSLALWLAIAWIAGYAIFFFSFTLPNSNPPTRRLDVWIELPDILWSNVVTPPQSTPSSWANLPQRFDLLAVAAAIWLGIWAIGSLALRAMRVPLAPRSAEHVVFACGLGASIVALLTLGCGLAGWLSPFGIGGALLAAIVIELAIRFRQRPEASARRVDDCNVARRRFWDSVQGVLTRGEQIPFEVIGKTLAVITMTLFLAAMLLGSLLPPTDFDVKAYHLTGPKEYFLDGRITFLDHNVYTNFPFLTEMLCLLGMVLRQDWFRGALAGQAALMGFAPLTALTLFCAGRRWFGPSTGWLAATFFLSTPWTYRLAIIAYVEGALSCYLLLALFATLLSVGGKQSGQVHFLEPDRKMDLTPFLPGLMAGSAMACKYPGLVSVVIPLGLAGFVAACRQSNAAWRCRDAFRVALLFGVGVTITIGPWLLKNLVMTGNPVYPLAYGLFGGRDWDAASHAKWRAGHSPNTFAIADLAEKFIDVSAKADWLSPLLFGLAPLAFVAIKNHKSKIENQTALVRWLWLYVAYLFAQWWLFTHRIDRFWVPLIPVVALLAAVGCEWSESKVWRRAGGAFVGLSVLFNLGFVTTSLCGFGAYLSDLDQAREGAESTAEGIHVLNQLFDKGAMPPDARVLCVGEAQVFDARPRVIYNTVFDQPIFREWLCKRPANDTSEDEWPLRSIDDVRRTFKQAQVTHVLVNWQELLRYRRTYGYSDFVAPKRFAWLREHGILGEPLQPAVRAMPSYDAMPLRDRQELDLWAPELKRRVDVGIKETTTRFIPWQIFPVRVD